MGEYVVHWDVVQKTSEWHELRYGRVGGTSSIQLYKKSDALYDELFAKHCEPYEDTEGFQSPDMERGNNYEDTARFELCTEKDIELLECGIITLENSLLSHSPDGLSQDLKIGCEIKCPASKAHHRMVRLNDADVGYHGQIANFFAVLKELEKLYFCSYRPESNVKTLFVKEYTRDSLINVGTEKTTKLITISKYCDELKEQDKKTLKKIKEDINKVNIVM